MHPLHQHILVMGAVENHDFSFARRRAVNPPQEVVRQFQFNLISSDTLRKAKADPEQYRGLVVRVAGYSAFFNELAEEIQDSIIARTAHML